MLLSDTLFVLLGKHSSVSRCERYAYAVPSVDRHEREKSMVERRAATMSEMDVQKTVEGGGGGGVFNTVG